MTDESESSSLRWKEHVDEKWQFFRAKLIGRLAQKGVASALTAVRPEPIGPGANAAQKAVEETIREFDRQDQIAYGLIFQSMLDCRPAILLLAQVAPDQVGMGQHAAATLAQLDARFDLMEDRTEATRGKDLEEAKILKAQSVTDFVSEVTNLFSRVHELNPDAYPPAQQKICLCDGLTNGELELAM